MEDIEKSAMHVIQMWGGLDFSGQYTSPYFHLVIWENVKHQTDWQCYQYSNSLSATKVHEKRLSELSSVVLQLQW